MSDNEQKAKSVQDAAREYCKKHGYKVDGYARAAFETGASFNQSQNEKLVKENQKLQEALGMYDGWPLTDVLLKLVESTEYLLDAKNYDRTGWEEVSACTKYGRAFIAKINNVLAEQALKKLYFVV